MAKEDDFEEQFKILEALLKQGLDPNRKYTILIPVQEFFKHTSGFSMDSLRSYGELAENDQYVKRTLDPYDDPLADLEGEQPIRVGDLLKEHGWNWEDHWN